MSPWIVSAACGLIVSIVSSLAAYLWLGQCKTCGMEVLYFAGAPLSLIGLVLYASVLSLYVCKFKLNAAVYLMAFLIGCHIGIWSSFRFPPCIYCLGAFAGILFAVLITWIKTPACRYSPFYCFVFGLVMISVMIQNTRLIQVNSSELQAIIKNLDNDKTLDRNLTNVVVYESDTCGVCKRFNSEYEPKLIRDSRAKLNFSIRSSSSITTYPTIIIVGKQTVSFVGLPPYSELLANINNL
jgi:hypothetical protein